MISMQMVGQIESKPSVTRPPHGPLYCPSPSIKLQASFPFKCSSLSPAISWASKSSSQSVCRRLRCLLSISLSVCRRHRDTSTTPLLLLLLFTSLLFTQLVHTEMLQDSYLESFSITELPVGDFFFKFGLDSWVGIDRATRSFRGERSPLLEAFFYFLSTFEIHLTSIPRQKILEKKLYQDREALDLIWILDTTIEIEASKIEKGYYSKKRSDEGEKKETKTKK